MLGKKILIDKYLNRPKELRTELIDFEATELAGYYLLHSNDPIRLLDVHLSLGLVSEVVANRTKILLKSLQ